MTIDGLCRTQIGLVLLGISLFFSQIVGAQHAHFPERIPGLLNALPVQFESLEQQLLVDATDGLLNTMGLIDAGLIASGANTPLLLSQYSRRLQHLQQHAVLSIPYLLQPEHRAAEIFYYLHKHVLRRFVNQSVTVLDLWHGGRYNCITASWIYLVLARRYDLSVTVVETPMHAFVQLQTDPPVPIELTLPVRGFNFSQTRDEVISNLLQTGLIHKSLLDEYGPDALFAAYLERQRNLTPVQVLAVFFYNRALDAFEQHNAQTAFQYALAAYLIHPEDTRYRLLTRDLGRAYATALQHDRQLDALEMMRNFLHEFAILAK